LSDHGVKHWAGARSLLLWLPVAASAPMQRVNSAFLEADGALRSPGSTLADALADQRQRGLERVRKAGLTRADDLALIGQVVTAT